MYRVHSKRDRREAASIKASTQLGAECSGRVFRPVVYKVKHRYRSSCPSHAGLPRRGGVVALRFLERPNLGKNSRQKAVRRARISGGGKEVCR